MKLLAFLIGFTAFAQAEVTAYPMNGDIPKFTGFSVSAGGTNIELYSIQVNKGRSWPGRPGSLNRGPVAVAMFDSSGGTISVVVNRPGTTSAVVRPARAGVSASVSGDSVSFTLPKEGQYSVEFNGNAVDDCLLIFASPPQGNPTGQILQAGTYGEQHVTGTLWLMPGALVRGKVVFESDGAKIMGRGIIDGSNSHSWDSGGDPVLPIEDYNHNDLTIDGISVFDPDGWTIQLQRTGGCKLNNMKIISSRQNSDGISIQSAQRISVTNSFVRTWDDSIVIKNYGSEASQSITVENTVVWSDFAQGLEIGVETNSGYDGQPNPVQISDVRYENVDIIHAFHKAPISIHNGDNCDVHDITYTNINVDDAQMGQGDGWNYIIDFTNMNGGEMGGDPGWTHNDGYRQIRNVQVDGVNILGGNSPGARIKNGGNGAFTNVRIGNVKFRGESLNVCNLAGGVPDGVSCS